MGCCDVDYAGDKLERKAIVEAVDLWDNLISWSSKRQSLIAHSIVEVEYIATSRYNTQMLWMKSQLEDF